VLSFILCLHQRYDSEMQAERSKHRAEMENLARHTKDAQMMAASMSPQRSPPRNPTQGYENSYAGSPNALVPMSSNHMSPTSSYGMTHTSVLSVLFLSFTRQEAP
jgi:hypothetical protein